MEIREVAEEDLREILGIINQEFPYTGITPQNFQQRLQNPNIFLFKAVEDEKFRGFVDVELFEDEHRGRINAVVVKKEFRGQGIGKELVEYGIAFLQEQGAEIITLLVDTENQWAKNLYRSVGFVSVGILSQKVGGKTVEEMKLSAGIDHSVRYVS